MAKKDFKTIDNSYRLPNKSSLVKMGLVSAEVFHYIQTRTNVAWTNVDGTNVPKTIDNSYRWSNHQTFKVWLSFDK